MLSHVNDYPFLRQVASPIDAYQLRALDPRCRVVQFFDPLTDADYQLLAEFMKGYPDVPLRIYGHPHGAADLSFLKEFPFLKGFQADVFDLQSLEGLEYLPETLEFLALGSTRKRFSLAGLARFTQLKDLAIEGHYKDIEVLSGLTGLTGLGLRSVTLPDLSALKPLASLKRLQIQLGGTNNLRLLPGLTSLRYLELWRIRGLDEVDVLPELSNLRYLFLQDLSRVTHLPSLRSMSNLRRVHIENLKGLSDLTPIAAAPCLEELVVLDMRQLTVDAFRCFCGHPTLTATRIALGSVRRNSEVAALLKTQDVADHRPIARYVDD